MDTRRANITVESHPSLTKALMAHLSVALTSHVVSDDDYDPWLPTIELWVDNVRTDFGIAHVITTGSRISGIALMHSVVPPDGGDNTLEFVAISFDKAGRSEVWQEVIMVNERIWLQNQGNILHELTNYLFII